MADKVEERIYEKHREQGRKLLDWLAPHDNLSWVDLGNLVVPCLSIGSTDTLDVIASLTKREGVHYPVFHGIPIGLLYSGSVYKPQILKLSDIINKQKKAASLKLLWPYRYIDTFTKADPAARDVLTTVIRWIFYRNKAIDNLGKTNALKFSNDLYSALRCLKEKEEQSSRQSRTSSQESEELGQNDDLVHDSESEARHEESEVVLVDETEQQQWSPEGNDDRSAEFKNLCEYLVQENLAYVPDKLPFANEVHFHDHQLEGYLPMKLLIGRVGSRESMFVCLRDVSESCYDVYFMVVDDTDSSGEAHKTTPNASDVGHCTFIHPFDKTCPDRSDTLTFVEITRLSSLIRYYFMAKGLASDIIARHTLPLAHLVATTFAYIGERMIRQSPHENRIEQDRVWATSPTCDQLLDEQDHNRFSQAPVAQDFLCEQTSSSVDDSIIQVHSPDWPTLAEDISTGTEHRPRSSPAEPELSVYVPSSRCTPGRSTPTPSVKSHYAGGRHTQQRSGKTTPRIPDETSNRCSPHPLPRVSPSASNGSVHDTTIVSSVEPRAVNEGPVQKNSTRTISSSSDQLSIGSATPMPETPASSSFDTSFDETRNMDPGKHLVSASNVTGDPVHPSSLYPKLANDLVSHCPPHVPESSPPAPRGTKRGAQDAGLEDINGRRVKDVAPTVEMGDRGRPSERLYALVMKGRATCSEAAFKEYIETCDKELSLETDLGEVDARIARYKSLIAGLKEEQAEANAETENAIREVNEKSKQDDMERSRVLLHADTGLAERMEVHRQAVEADNTAIAQKAALKQGLKDQMKDLEDQIALFGRLLEGAEESKLSTANWLEQAEQDRKRMAEEGGPALHVMMGIEIERRRREEMEA